LDQYPFDLDLAFTFAFASLVVVAHPSAYVASHHYFIKVQIGPSQYFGLLDHRLPKLVIQLIILLIAMVITPLV